MPFMFEVFVDAVYAHQLLILLTKEIQTLFVDDAVGRFARLHRVVDAVEPYTPCLYLLEREGLKRVEVELLKDVLDLRQYKQLVLDFNCGGLVHWRWQGCLII